MLEALDDTNVGIVYRLYNTPPLVTTAMGYELYYIYMLEKPDFIKDFQKIVNEHVLEQAEIVLSYPIDAVMVGNYLCMNTGPIMSPDAMEEFEYPYLIELVDLARGKNKIVEYHVDGNYTSLYPKLIDIGIDIVQAIQECEGMHGVFELKERYGDSLAFHGDIDVNRFLINGTESEINHEVKRHIQHINKGGGYICGSSHDINIEVSENNFFAMINAIIS
jgi:uroporphyrinogen decarboxylase